MAKILAPNKNYTGVSASVSFCNGIGTTDKPELKEWFKNHNYQVIEEEIKDKTLDDMSVEELISYAEKNNIDIGKASSQAGIIEKIKATESENKEDDK
ncbi:hypothetical protein [Clostridium sp. BJN0001]|uniref:hypothetical protein n=1 Tax=Clostridium sp. BJN0001 TaxID=2930219 RepID=UPI001FCF7EA5|nr:hypothetical protein [Clostridium sp. BJN0001]